MLRWRCSTHFSRFMKKSAETVTGVSPIARSSFGGGPRKVSARLRTCVLLLGALIADVFVMQLVMHDAPFFRQFFLGGLAGVILAVALAVVASDESYRANVLAAAVAVVVWLGAITVGDMFAKCDPVMRLSIIPMVAWLMPAPFVGWGLVLAVVPISVGAGWLGRKIFRQPPTVWAYGAIAAASVVIAVTAYLVATALGARPTPTACVL